jgi:hypothetical protein
MMPRNASRSLLVLVVSTILVGCSGTNNPDSGIDSGIDGGPDAGIDGGTDAGLYDGPIGTTTTQVPILAGYNVSLFANGGTVATSPDSLEWDGTTLWVGYQNNSSKTGGPNEGTSTIIGYGLNGTQKASFSVPGHCDGVRVDPSTGLVWASSNEDANPVLNSYNPDSGVITPYTFPNPTPHGGGFDDMAFINGKLFIAASNPQNFNAQGLNSASAVYQVIFDGGTGVNLAGVVPGNFANPDPATNGQLPTANLTDPDSMTTDMSGDLVLVSQADNLIVVVTNPGETNQTVWPYVMPTQLDDTVWIKNPAGVLFVADIHSDNIYAVQPTTPWNVGDIWTELPDDSSITNLLGTVASAAIDGGTATQPAYPNFATWSAGLPPNTGVISPVAIGLNKPSGLLFVPIPNSVPTSTPPTTPPIVPGYTVGLFASGGTTATAPDSLEWAGSTLWVGYQNHSDKTGGPDAGTSTIVGYDAQGTQTASFSVPGHCDGVRVDPATGLVWASSNEDANPVLNSYNPDSGVVSPFSFPAPTPHGGGFDDMAFINGKLFIAASNPQNFNAQGFNSAFAVYEVVFNGTPDVTLAGVLPGSFANPDPATNGQLPMVNLTDPDSMTTDMNGNLVLVSQADDLIVVVTNPGQSTQTQWPYVMPTQLDDTVWIKADAGTLYVADINSNNIYKIQPATGSSWNPGDIWTELPDDSSVTNLVGTVASAVPDGGTGTEPAYPNFAAWSAGLPPNTGVISPMAIGFDKPPGLLFVPAP